MPEAWSLIFRDLAVDHVQVYPLGAPVEPKADVHGERYGVEDEHVDQGLAVVDAVEVVEEPLVDAEDEEPAEGRRRDRDQRYPEDPVAGDRGGVVDVGFEPGHQRRRDRRAEERDRDDEHGVEHVDRKSTRLNSSHANISYAVFCLKKKNSQTSNPAVSYTN